jgi:toxin ParE1/3/4
MKVQFTTRARQDLQDIGDYIALDNPFRARSFVVELRDASLGLGDRPLRFPLLESFEDQGYRRRVHGSYLIIYRVDADIVRIIRVISSSVDLHGLGL